MANTIEITLPAIVTLTNISTTEKVGFVPYRENFTSYIAAGDIVKLEVQTAGQVLYYLAQASDKLKVEQAAKAQANN